MDMFSLEDDDANELFITQTPSSSNVGIGNSGIMADNMDFTSPCKSLIPDGVQKKFDFSDISDDEIFEIPCSQKNVKPMGENRR